MGKRITKKQKRRLLLYTVLIIPIAGLFAFNMFSYWTQIYKNIKEKNVLKTNLTEKLEEEERLNKEITKLNDSDYIAKYAREKYLYSKNGEIMIRIDDEKDN